MGAACAAIVGGPRRPPPQRPGPAPHGPPWAAQVDAVFAQWDRPDSPGCALGVYQDGRIVYARGYGMADLEHDAPITPGLGLLRRLGLEAVHRHGRGPRHQAGQASARMTMCGSTCRSCRTTAGRSRYGTSSTTRAACATSTRLMVLAGRRDEDAFDNEAVLRIVPRQKALNFLPGDEHLYSNSGYAMLALAVERATGTPFAELRRREHLQAAGHDRSAHFHTDLSRLVPGRAWAYDRRPDGIVRAQLAAERTRRRGRAVHHRARARAVGRELLRRSAWAGRT
ncbi:MAG: beta-lactamase family protein [Ignavibacteriales bacterium]|nr:beta-lactamase family protein [Ignavibacteriales bacterium]